MATLDLLRFNPYIDNRIHVGGSGTPLAGVQQRQVIYITIQIFIYYLGGTETRGKRGINEGGTTTTPYLPVSLAYFLYLRGRE